MKRGLWMVGAVAVAANVAFLAWVLPVQARRSRPAPPVLRLARQDAAPPPAAGVAAPAPADDPAPGETSVGDALIRPFDFPFDQPTSLADVQKHLAKTLGVAVALDRAALERLEIDADETVQLDLKGVRLKTGLKLLLDQVGMAYRVEAEDNLLVLTDPREAGEPIDRALHQLKALHEEMHDLQDAVDDLRDLVEEDLGVEPEGDDARAAYVRFRPHPRGDRPAGRLGDRRSRPAESRRDRPVRSSGGPRG